MLPLARLRLLMRRPRLLYCLLKALCRFRATSQTDRRGRRMMVVMAMTTIRNRRLSAHQWTIQEHISALDTDSDDWDKKNKPQVGYCWCLLQIPSVSSLVPDDNARKIPSRLRQTAHPVPNLQDNVVVGFPPDHPLDRQKGHSAL